VKHVFFGYWVALVVLLFAGGAGTWFGSWNNQLQGKMRQAFNLVRNFLFVAAAAVFVIGGITQLVLAFS